MQLKNLDISSFVRITQGEFDIEVDVFKNAEVTQEFYALLFFDLMNGNVTGADNPPLITGIKAKIYDTGNNLVSETSVSKLDWFETQTSYVINSETTSSFNPASDVYLSKVELIYVANDSGSAREVTITESSSLASSVFATTAPDNTKGVRIVPGATDVGVSYTITIAK